MAKFVVTGASGTTGFEVVRALRERNESVRATVRASAKGDALAALGAEVVTVDFDDPKSLSRAFQGCDRLFMLTPFDPLGVDRVKAMLSAAKQAGVDYIVRMSAAGADRGGALEKMHHHGECEELVRSFGIRCAFIRPTFFMDNLFKYYSDHLHEGVWYACAKQGGASYVSSRDIGECAAVVLLDPETHAGHAYSLTGNRAYSDAELAAHASAVAGRKIEYVDVSPEERLKMMRASGLPDWFSEEIVAGEQVKASGVAAGMTTTVKQLLGRDPEDLDSFLLRKRELLS
jgi:uncharacterized protein YbjT (DUF2867 family)